MSTWTSKHLSWLLASIVVAAALGLSEAGHAAARPTSPPQESYTAQRKPRISIIQFDDTNLDATQERYGPSVSAMMVTFFKTKSQFVVVERRDLDQVFAEWTLVNEGKVNETLDTAKIELLEQLDALLHGKVTLLDGNRVEVDVKLLSRLDGRIITAAKHHGSVSCLRQVVERLGSEIERNYLRSYYGKLKVSYKEPTNTHIFLTPVLTSQSLDEEKPPVELDRTVFPGSAQDVVSRWVTSPTSYTIENVLSGWYTLRLSRPGYRDIGTEYSLWQARAVGSSTKVFYYCAAEKKYLPADASSSGRCDAADRRQGEPHWLELLVYVPPLGTAELDLTARGFKMVKQNGTIDLEVVDYESKPLAQMRVLVKSLDLEINPNKPDNPKTPTIAGQQGSGLEAPRPLANGAGPSVQAGVTGATVDLGKASKVVENHDGRQQAPELCQYLVDDPVLYLEHEPRIVRVGDTFAIDNYAGGELAFEDYRGEAVPTGVYEVAVWAPYYEHRRFKFEVKEGAKDSTRITVARRRDDVLLRGWSENQVAFTGTTTGHRVSIELKPESGSLPIELPLDRYQVDATVVGLRPSLHDLNLLPAIEKAPGLEIFDGAWAPAVTKGPHGPRELRIKDRVWVGGRLGGFQRSPRAFYDVSIGELLDAIFRDPETYEWEAEDGLDEELLARLKEALDDIDLLILDDEDMLRMRVIPELEKLIGEYVASGHALMAFVTAPGAYGSVLGAPFTLKKRNSDSSKFKLLPGELSNFHPTYHVELDADRLLPRLKKPKATRGYWRVVSFGKKKRRPRVLERGVAETGGYALVWLDGAKVVVDPLNKDPEPGDVATPLDPADLSKIAPDAAAQEVAVLTTLMKTAKPKQAKKLEKMARRRLEAILKARLANQDIFLARSEIKNHALLWAEYLMYRRLDAGGEKLREARSKLAAASAPATR